MQIHGKAFEFIVEEKVYYNKTPMPCEKVIKKVIAQALNISSAEVSVKVTYGHLDDKGRYATLESIKVPVYDYELISDYIQVLKDVNLQEMLENENV